MKSDEEILKTYFDFYCTLMHIACNMYNVYRFNTGWGITLWLFLPHDYFTDVYKSLDSWSNHHLWTLYIYFQVLVQRVMLSVTPEGLEIVLTPRRWILETELVINLFSGVYSSIINFYHFEIIYDAILILVG